jgi:hypothetical protein
MNPGSWLMAIAYAAVMIGIVVLISSSSSISVFGDDAGDDNNNEPFMNGDKDQDNILGDGLCPPKRKKVPKQACDPIVPMKRRKRSLCNPLSAGEKIEPFDYTEVAALAADANFDVNDVLRGDGACLRAVAESAEDDEARAREEINTTDSGAIYPRLLEYRNLFSTSLLCE